jgi:phenylalanyl-tRNA synthetase alpha chain
VDELQQRFEHELLSCQTKNDVEALRLQYLGRKGCIQDEMRKLKDISAEDRPVVGARLNVLKKYIEEKLDEFTSMISEKEREIRMKGEHLDITLPGRRSLVGARHPLTDAIENISRIFKDLGFSIQVGPQIDSEYYNFEVLNFPKDHPARDMQDTFYIEPGVLLRTHTSTIQGRVMERTVPPIRIVCPGRVFRNESVSARAHAFFHQVEGLCVDKESSMQDCFWTLREFIRRFFQRDDIELRFRPSYFPFVEPGTEVDASCMVCQGAGCTLCKHSGWLEVCGAGMVHPQVLRNVGIDPEKYRGYAWGFGIERLVMLKRGIRDLRLFSENDMRFLQQFQVV